MLTAETILSIYGTAVPHSDCDGNVPFCSASVLSWGLNRFFVFRLCFHVMQQNVPMFHDRSQLSRQDAITLPGAFRVGEMSHEISGR